MKYQYIIVIAAVSLLAAAACSQSTPDASQGVLRENQALEGAGSDDSSPGQDQADYPLTPLEESQQGVHIYQVEGTANTSSENRVGGDATVSNRFEENGVWFECFGYLPETFFERVSENTFQATVEDGSAHSLRYDQGGFQWIGTNSDGSPKDWTFTLSD